MKLQLTEKMIKNLGHYLSFFSIVFVGACLFYADKILHLQGDEALLIFGGLGLFSSLINSFILFFYFGDFAKKEEASSNREAKA